MLAVTLCCFVWAPQAQLLCANCTKICCCGLQSSCADITKRRLPSAAADSAGVLLSGPADSHGWHGAPRPPSCSIFWPTVTTRGCQRPITPASSRCRCSCCCTFRATLASRKCCCPLKPAIASSSRCNYCCSAIWATSISRKHKSPFEPSVSSSTRCRGRGSFSAASPQLLFTPKTCYATNFTGKCH